MVAEPLPNRVTQAQCAPAQLLQNVKATRNHAAQPRAWKSSDGAQFRRERRRRVYSLQPEQLWTAGRDIDRGA
jgi:hypothetical protein